MPFKCTFTTMLYILVSDLRGLFEKSMGRWHSLPPLLSSCLHPASSLRPKPLHTDKSLDNLLLFCSSQAKTAKRFSLKQRTLPFQKDSRKKISFQADPQQKFSSFWTPSLPPAPPPQKGNVIILRDFFMYSLFLTDNKGSTKQTVAQNQKIKML